MCSLRGCLPRWRENILQGWNTASISYSHLARAWSRHKLAELHKVTERLVYSRGECNPKRASRFGVDYFREREEKKAEEIATCNVFRIAFLFLHALQGDVTRIMPLCYTTPLCMTQPDYLMVERNTINPVPKRQTGGYKSIIIKLSPLNKVK